MWLDDTDTWLIHHIMWWWRNIYMKNDATITTTCVETHGDISKFGALGPIQQPGSQRDRHSVLQPVGFEPPEVTE